MDSRKIILITTDNHTLGIQTVANIIYKKSNILPSMFYLPSDLPEYPPKIEANILCHIFKEIDKSDGKVLVGFHLKELSLTRSLQLANKIKQYRSDKVKLVAGGTYATVKPSALLWLFDYVVVGDGRGILKVLCAVFQEKNIKRILFSPFASFEYPLFPDSWILDENGDITRGTARPLSHPQYKKSKALEIMLGIGCGYSCSYCEVAVLRKIYGHRYKISLSEPEQAINLMKKEIDLVPSIQYIYFFDEDFLLKPTTWIESFTSLYGEKIGLPFFIFSTPYSVHKFPHKILKLSQAGLDTVNMGIQCGSERISKGLFGRKECKDEIKTCVDFLTGLHLKGETISPPMLDFIILNPYERVDELLETIYLINDLSTPFKAIMHCMSFFRGTPLYEKARAEGVISEEYRFRYDLHDFMSRVRENDLQFDSSNEESLKCLFLNVLLYGMKGIHEVCEGVRYLGSLTMSELRQHIQFLRKNRVTYNDIISIANSVPNPMDKVYVGWRNDCKLIPSNIKFCKTKEREIYSGSAVNV